LGDADGRWYVATTTDLNTRRILNHLAERGAQSIALLLPRADWGWAAETRSAYEAWMSERGARPLVVPVALSPAEESGQRDEDRIRWPAPREKSPRGLDGIDSCRNVSTGGCRGGLRPLPLRRSEEESSVHKPRSRLSRVRLACAAIAGTAVALAALGGTSSLASSVTRVTLPAGSLGQPGTIRYCSDISSPPLEFYKNGTQATGSDIDLGDAIAAAMGLKPLWVNTAFAGIIPALQAGHCDAIMSELYDKASRRGVVDFVDYMYSSEAVLVAAGNPHHITGINDLCGDKVAAETGTTITDYLATQSKACTKAKKAPITVQTFLRDSDALEQLALGHVDAYGTTIETGAYDMSKSTSHEFQFAGGPFGQILAGIATRKNDKALHNAIAKAFAVVKSDGKYRQIFTKWGLQGDLLR
jgi:polar amino acid transport system substrate-binding protein